MFGVLFLLVFVGMLIAAAVLLARNDRRKERHMANPTQMAGISMAARGLDGPMEKSEVTMDTVDGHRVGDLPVFYLM